MAAKKESSISPGKLVLYDKLVLTIPEIERKGATLPYTSYNGHMFSFLSPEGVLALRLSESDRVQFLKKYKTTLMEAQGTVMKEYVRVPDSLLKKTNEVKRHLEASLKYVKTLKPKKK